jgi:hypothetical protein
MTNLGKISICQSFVRSPPESAVYMPSNRCRTVAPNIHVLAVLRRLDKRPHMDLVGSQWDNLQKWWKIWFVKDKIISNMPYGPYDCTNSHSYVNFINLDNDINPITKKMWNAGRRSNIKSLMHNCPNNLSKRALSEYMLHILLRITETKKKLCIDVLLKIYVLIKLLTFNGWYTQM